MSVFKKAIAAELARREQSPIQAALASGLNRDALRFLNRGSAPIVDRAEEICDALDLEFYIGPPREAAAAAPQQAFDRFDAEVDMPVLGYARCSLFGHLQDEKEFPDLPALDGISAIDPDAFYAIAKGPSMIPEGISEGDYCLVSPNTPVTVGGRVWLRDRQGKACIKRLMDESETTYALRGWMKPERGRQRAYDDEWLKTNIERRGSVLAVWRGRPDVKSPPELIPDPKAPSPPAPAAFTSLLDLPEGASMEDVIRAIEELRDSGDVARVLQEKTAEAVQAQIAASLGPGGMPRIREIDLVFPTMAFLASRPDGTATTREIITHLEDRFQPAGEDAETLKDRADSRFSQIVRNMISHRDSAHSFIGNGYADYLKDPGRLRITEKGRTLLAEMAEA